jgi:hypothetical protein
VLFVILVHRIIGHGAIGSLRCVVLSSHGWCNWFFMLLMLSLVCDVASVIIGLLHCWSYYWFIMLLVLLVCHITGAIGLSHVSVANSLCCF